MEAKEELAVVMRRRNRNYFICDRNKIEIVPGDQHGTSNESKLETHFLEYRHNWHMKSYYLLPSFALSALNEGWQHMNVRHQSIFVIYSVYISDAE